MNTDYSNNIAKFETLPPTPQCPICGSRKHVIRVALNVEKGASLIQRLFCNFCNNEWVDTISK